MSATDRQNNLLTWALSHSFNLIFDEVSPDIVLTVNDLSPDLVKYNHSKIIYYNGEPFLSWSGDIDKNVIDKALTNFNFDDPLFERVPLILHYNYEYFKNGYINDYEFLLKEKPNIINNTTNIQYILKQPGTESIDHLSTEKQREIMQKKIEEE
jgi:hypothetical protein